MCTGVAKGNLRHSWHCRCGFDASVWNVGLQMAAVYAVGNEATSTNLCNNLKMLQQVSGSVYASRDKQQLQLEADRTYQKLHRSPIHQSSFHAIFHIIFRPILHYPRISLVLKPKPGPRTLVSLWLTVSQIISYHHIRLHFINPQRSSWTLD